MGDEGKGWRQSALAPSLIPIQMEEGGKDGREKERLINKEINK